MNNINAAKPSASHYVSAVCAAVEDLGVISTKFGIKSMVKFAFDTDELDEYGQKRRLTRLFHRHTHPLSALSTAVKSWCDRDLAAEEECQGRVNWQSFVGTGASLKLVPGAVKDGRCFDNITEILPLRDEGAELDCEPQEAE